MDKRFSVVKELGSGGQGLVVLVRDALRPNEPVALKRIADASAKHDLEMEFSRLSAMKHPNLARAYDLFRDEEGPYFTSEFVDGVDILAWSRGADEKAILAVLADLLSALAFVHSRGWVHGDLSLGNVLVKNTDSKRPVVKLLDLGSARRVGEEALATTAGFSAPEVLRGNGVRISSDLYSFGVLLVRTLFNAHPFGEGNASSIVRTQLTETPALPDIESSPLLALGSRLLDSDAGKRPSTATQTLSLMSEAAGRDLRKRFVECAGGDLPEPKFIGRRREQSLLEEMLIHAQAGGTTRVARITGPKGSGKSALLEELVRFAQLEGFQRIGRVRTQTTTDDLIGQLIEAMGAGTLDEETRSALSPWMMPKPKPPKSGIRSDADAVQFAASRLVAELARAKPVLVVVDDVERADRTVQQIVSAIARSLSPNVDQRPTAALLLTQDAQIAGQSDWDSQPEWIPLNPLEKEDTHALVESMLPGVVYDEGIRDAIYLVSKGWPGIAAQYVRQSAGQKNVDDLEDAAKQHIRALDTRSRDLLMGLSRTDRPIPVAIIDQLEGGSEPIRRLIKKGFVLERENGDGKCVVVHPTLGRIASEMDRDGRATPIAQRMGALLEQDGALEDAAALYVGCGAVEEGTRIFATLANQTLSNGDRVGAGAWFEKALQHTTEEGESEALARKALPVFEATGQMDRALDALHRSGLSKREKEQKQAEFAFQQGHHLDALRIATRLATQFPKDPFTANIIARAKMQLGEYEQSLSAVLEALETSPNTEPPVQRISELARTGAVAAIYLGRLDPAKGLLERAAKGFDQIEDAAGQITVLADRGMLARRVGDLRAALAHYEEAIARAKQIGNKRIEGLHRMNRGAVALVMGNIRQAADDYKAALNIAIVLGNAFARAQVEVNLADLLSGVGKQEAALRLATQAATRCRALGQSRLESRAHLVTGTALLRARDLPRAERRLRRAKQGFNAAGDDVGRLSSDLAFAELRIQKGDFSGADRFGSGAADAARAGERPGHLARALTIRARAAIANEEGLAEAIAQLNEAAKLLEEESLPDETWRNQVHLARALRLTNAFKESAIAMESARRGFEAVKRNLPSEWVESFSNYAEASELDRVTDDSMGNGDSAGRADNLAKLMEVNRELTRERNLKRLLERIMAHAVDLTGAERGMVLMKRAGSVESVISHQISETEDVNFSQSVATQVLAKEQAVLAIDALGDERFRTFESVHAMKLRSILAVPLRIRTEVVGVIYLDSKLRTGVFREADRELLEAFGSQAAIALETARLISENENRCDDLEKANAQIQQLSHRLEDKLKRNEAKLKDVGALLTKTQKEEADRLRTHGMIGRSIAMRKIMQLVDRVAVTDVPVYIFGPSGTGKELLAKAIHAESSRRDKTFVPVNCGALPPKLLASELFGHTKGAFTGASGDRPGLFRLAHEGTLFLDEVSSMDAEMQAYLLRVLQDGTFRSLGDTEEISVDVRVLSASNRDLAQEVALGRFREDLFYRLNVVRADVPPLAERSEDIPLLVAHFAAQYAKGEPTAFSQEALACLMRADWPGNVRELENEVLRSITFSEAGRTIEPKDLSPRLSPSRVPFQMGQGSTLKQRVDGFERGIIEQVLDECDGNATQAAKKLGISRAGFYKKLEKYPGLRD